MTQRQMAMKRKHIGRINHLIAVKGDPQELAQRKEDLANQLPSDKRV